MSNLIYIKTKKNNIYSLVISFLLTSRILDIDIPIFIYYATIIGLFLNLFFRPRELKLESKLIFVFIFILFISIIFNVIPSFFKSYERYFSFLLSMLVFSPLFRSNRLIRFREEIFESILVLFVIYTLISFLGLVVGVFPIKGFGGFQGVTVHGMTMSIVASISFLTSLGWFYKYKKMMFILIMIISFMVLILGASRGALLATFLGLICFQLGTSKVKLKAISNILIFMSLIFISVMFAPTEYLDRIMQKFSAISESGKLIGSRELLWESRINEFKTSPIIGIGFGNMIEELNDYGINESGGIESGSSWGMILSMSGLLGFSIFLFFIFNRIKSVLKSQNNIFNGFIFGLLLFFLIHMMFEGYVFASGSVFMILFWLTISMTYQLKFNKI